MTAAEHILEKALLPTHLNAREIREQVARDIRRRSLWTARCAERAFLEPLQEACADVAGGKINNALFREKMRGVLDALGYDPVRGGWVDDPFNDGEPVAGLSNLRSARRLDLIADTQRLKAASAARLASQTPSVLALWPAWRLERYATRTAERDWPERWQAAADEVDWEGVAASGLVALKGSPIWQALGDGAGGYTDATGDATPPFAYNSGMDWTDVDRDECEALGLNPGDAVAEDAGLSPDERDIRRAREKYGDAFVDELLAEFDELEKGDA